MEMAMLTVRARRFLLRTGRNLGANGPTSTCFDMSKVECYNCHRKGHFARECRSPKDTRRNGAAEPQRRNVLVETSTLNALVSQCDGVGRDNALVSLRQNLEKAEQERDDLKLKLEKFQTSSKNLTELLASQTNAKTEDESETKAPKNVPSFVQPTEEVKTPRPSVQHVKISISAATPKPANPKPTSNGKQRNRKACIVCKILDHLIKDWDYHEKKMAQPIARNHPPRGTNKHYASMTHSNPQRHVVPIAVLTQSKLVLINATRPVSTDVPKIKVTRPSPAKPIVTKSTSLNRRIINHSPSPKTSNSPLRVTVVKAPMVNAAQGMQGKWEWKPKCLILDHVSRNTSASMTLKRFDYNDVLGRSKSSKVDILPLEVILKVMCDKKNSVLFTDTECLVLSPEFKLLDESQVPLRVPRENNMYNVNLKNIVPFGDLTCLFVKPTIDESKLWHRLGHINFKTMNKLVKGKFDGKVGEGFLVGYSVSSKAFRVFNSRTRIVQETLHVNYLKNKANVASSGPTWLFDIDTLTKTMNYQPVTTGNQANPSAGFQDKFVAEKEGEVINQQYVLFPVWSSCFTNPHNTNGDAAFDEKEPEFDEKKPESEVNISPSSKFEDFSANCINEDNVAGTLVPTVGQISPNSTNIFSAAGPSNAAASPTQGKSSCIDASQLPDDPDMPELEDITYSDNEDDVGGEADFNNLETSITVSPIPTTRVHKDHPVTQIIGDLSSATQTRSMTRVAKDQDGKSASTPIDTEKPLLKDPAGVNIPRSDEDRIELMELTVFLLPSDEKVKVDVSAVDLQVNDVTRLQALMDKKKVVITEATIRDVLRLDDAKEYTSPALTQKVFANMRRVGKGFSRVETPLFEGMIMKQQVAEGDDDEVNDGGVPAAGNAAEGDVSAVNDEVPTANEEPSIPSPTPPTPPPQPYQDIPSTSQDAGIPMNLLQEVMDTYTTLKRRVEHLELDKIAQALEITKLKQRVKKLERRNKVKVLKLRRLQKVETTQRIDTSDDTVMDYVSNQGRVITEMDKDVDVVLEEAKEIPDKANDVQVNADLQGKTAESQAEIYKINLEHANKVLSMQEDESEPAESQEVLDVVTTAKIITEVVTAASETITAASTNITTTEAQVPATTLTASPSRVIVAPSRRRKRVVIRDPEEFTTPSTIIPAETKSKDKEVKLNRNIDWDEVIDHVNKKVKEDNAVKRYQAIKRKPQTEAQARKNMMIYLRNVAGYKMDYFKGMSYNDICPVFEKYFDLTVAFLQKTKEQMDEEDSRALKRLNETPAEKVVKRQNLNEEVEELKRHLQIVPNDDDDVLTEATPLARKVPVVDYEIIN
nr:ribonuclease H-like domain-containing protein [Tanacetum cinerariifolium]